MNPNLLAMVVASRSALVALCLAGSLAHAETVTVKYRGTVDLAPFRCTTVARSSLVNRVCYMAQHNYMIIGLKGTYYHYCGIPGTVVNALLQAPSMGRFYNQQVRGRFDCRITLPP